MSKKDKPVGPETGAEKPAIKVKRKRRTLVRKTRYLALEQRIVFDGALAVDIVDKTTQTPGDAANSADTAGPADKTLPAVDWSQTRSSPAVASDGKGALPAPVTDKAAADERSAGLAPETSAAARNEIVFVDPSVKNFQAFMKDLSPSAHIVMLDAGRDGMQQIAAFVATQSHVDAINIVAYGNAEMVQLGTARVDAASIDGTYAASLAQIGTHLGPDASFKFYGSDFGKGGEGQSAATRLSALTGADVSDVAVVPDSAPGASHQVVFLDMSVPDYKTLLAGIDDPNAQVVLIDGARDPLDQIASYMDGQSGISAIHIISHGSEGELILAGRNYTADVLSQQYSMDMARIGRALAPDGDILLYGCDIAEGSAGQRFIDQVAKMTGADIAASTDLTGATYLGGDWVLEAKTGQIDAQSIFSQMQDQWGFLLNVAPINIGGATLSFNDARRTLVSGTDKAVGAVYKYANVATISGTQIDAYVTITGITGASITTVDQDAPTGYTPPLNTNTNTATTAADPFAPEIVTTAAGGHVDFTFDFKDPAGNILTLNTFASNSIDIDGQTTSPQYQEFDEYGGFKSYTVATPTDLAISPGLLNTDQVRFQGTSAYNGLIVNDVGRVQANFDAVSTLTISFGANASTQGNARQYGDLFASVSIANPVTVTAPTVDLETTSNNTPTLTGTLGGETSLAPGEGFKVTFQGTDYTTANGLVINADGTWSLPVTTALPAGSYEVRAVRTLSSGMALPDQTHGELVINNAPVLNDTPLGLTVTEDAPAAAGAIGSLVSAFTGGISDQDPSASKGIAIIGADETNGKWYYTVDGGTTWTWINQLNGLVATNNALLLADNANTRIYFRPNADYNIDVSSALTIRAWDQTRGTIGAKVDPADPTIGGGVGGVYSFSTATDVVDVSVLSVNDMPVRTAGTVGNLTVLEDASIASLNWAQ